MATHATHATHRWAVDAIEEGVARIEEDGARMITVPRHLLPAGVEEGQLLSVIRGESSSGSVQITIAIDEEATRDALERSTTIVARASTESKKRDPGGDVAL
jgi:hypothetical protein